MREGGLRKEIHKFKIHLQFQHVQLSVKFTCQISLSLRNIHSTACSMQIKSIKRQIRDHLPTESVNSHKNSSFRWRVAMILSDYSTKGFHLWYISSEIA